MPDKICRYLYKYIDLVPGRTMYFHKLYSAEVNHETVYFLPSKMTVTRMIRPNKKSSIVVCKSLVYFAL